MRYTGILLICAFAVAPLLGQDEMAGPKNEKAQKTYRQAMDFLKQHNWGAALDDFKKADKQDGGHCMACQSQIITCGIKLGEWKAAETAAEEFVEEAKGVKNIAIAHYALAVVLMEEALVKHKEEPYARAHEEIGKALEMAPNFPLAVYKDGLALAHMNQDEAAKAQFEHYAKMVTPGDPDRGRALLYASRPELARLRMAPPFAVTTIDGQHISLDELKGKVVLVDFWATWCAPCREALPHMREIARKFQGQPLVILSVSLDSDENKWKDFIAKNGMTWLNCRDGGFEGPVATQFDVHAIPHTFTIDADGVLQDEHVGDAAVEGKLKKQLARARELQVPDKAVR